MLSFLYMFLKNIFYKVCIFIKFIIFFIRLYNIYKVCYDINNIFIIYYILIKLIKINI